MSNELSHKGYKGTCTASIEDSCLHGRIQDIDDLITYEGNTIPELVEAFKHAVDHYLEHCTQIGKNPNKPYSGTFNVRVGPDLHKAATQYARDQDKYLNDVVCEALTNIISKPKQPATIHHEVIINHNIIRYEQKIDTPFSAEDTSEWQQKKQRKPLLRLVG